MKNIILAIVLLALSSTVVADVWLDVHMDSKHLNGTYSLNENNKGFGLAVPLSSNAEIIVGVLENGYYKTSGYAGVDIHTNSNKLWSTGVKVGYLDDPVDGVDVMVVPHVTVNFTDYFRTVIGYIPELPAKRSSAVTLSIGVKF